MGRWLSDVGRWLSDVGRSLSDVGLLVFGMFVVWVLWGLLQYALSRWPHDQSEDGYADNRFSDYEYRYTEGRWSKRATLKQRTTLRR